MVWFQAGSGITTHLQLVPSWRIRRTKCLLPPCAFTVCTGPTLHFLLLLLRQHKWDILDMSYCLKIHSFFIFFRSCCPALNIYSLNVYACIQFYWYLHLKPFSYRQQGMQQQIESQCEIVVQVRKQFSVLTLDSFYLSLIITLSKSVLTE
jgi:hypothetical protein